MNKREYPEVLLEKYGNDLNEVFGSLEEQEQKIDLASIAGNKEKIDEIKDAICKINNGVLDVHSIFGKNSVNPFIDVMSEIIDVLRQVELPSGKKLFEVYKLPKLGEQINRVGGEVAQWNDLRLRYPIQREVKIWHIIVDIIIDWDYDLNDPAYVRILTDGTMNVNDKQHGNFGRLLMGAPDVLIEGVRSDEPSVDANMYASRNIHNLETSWENNTNVRSERADNFSREGKSIKISDQPYYEFTEIMSDNDCGFQEKGLPKKAGICQNGEKLYGDLQHYDKETFVHSLQIQRQVWPHGELAREVEWFTSELQKQYIESGNFTKGDLRDLRTWIKQVLKTSHPDKPNYRNRATGTNTFWGECKKFMKSLPNKGDNKDFRHTISANYLGAAGLRDLILNWNSYMKAEFNRTPVKIELPEIIDADGRSVDVKVGFYKDGINSKVKPYHRDKTVIENDNDIVEYSSSTIVFDDEEETV